jgi:superfamily I DNA/RNA helicase
VLEYTDARGLQRLLSQVLHRLVIEEQVSPQDIAVLTPRSQDRSDLKANTPIGNFQLTTSSEPGGIYRVQVSSVHTFKGLERRVIILAELDNTMTHSPDEVLYVGCSRARTHLILLLDTNWSIEAKSKVESYAA